MIFLETDVLYFMADKPGNSFINPYILLNFNLFPLINSPEISKYMTSHKLHQ